MLVPFAWLALIVKQNLETNITNRVNTKSMHALEEAGTNVIAEKEDSGQIVDIKVDEKKTTIQVMQKKEALDPQPHIPPAIYDPAPGGPGAYYMYYLCSFSLESNFI